MTKVTSSNSTGYELQRVTTVASDYRLLESPTDEPDRAVELKWDWRATGARTFEVFVRIEVGPQKASNDAISVSMIATFALAATEPKVKLTDFVKYNAVALVIPFLREAVASMTARGFYKVFYLEPIDVVSTMKTYDVAQSTGHTQLESNEFPELRAAAAHAETTN